MEQQVLDKGYVKLIDMSGDDYRVLQAARTSTGNEAKKGDEKDRGLIRYLYRNEHMTPFEMVNFTFQVKMPIFVARQWMRHRTFKFNEMSLRYTESLDDYYVPDSWREQDTENKQSSVNTENSVPTSFYTEAMENSITTYKTLLDQGVAREQARMLLPVSMYTVVFMNVDLRNLLHFLQLRMHEHAQWEIQEYAKAIYSQLKQIGSIKWSMEIFEETLVADTAFSEAKNQYKADLHYLAEDIQGLL